MTASLRLLLFTALGVIAAGCSESAADRDRDRVLAMTKTLRPAVEAALGDALGKIEVTAVGEPEVKARVLATIRAGTREKLTREEFERRFAAGTQPDVFGGQDDPAADVEGNLYFRALPAGDEALARNIEAALVRSYQIRTLKLHPFLRDASGEEEWNLRYRIFLRHGRFVLDRLAKSRGAGRPLILPGAGSDRPRCLANRIARLATAEFKAWDERLAACMAKRFPELSPTEAFKAFFADPPRSSEEVTGLATAGPGIDLATRASEALWPRLSAGAPTTVLPEVVEAHFLTAGREQARRAADLVRRAFLVDAEGERGFVKIWVFGTGSDGAARELEALWLEEERALDEACRPGTESEALLLAEYDDVEIAGGRGTLIRRLEEHRDFLGLSARPEAWGRPERLVLVCQANLLVVELPYALAFPTNAVGVARLILDAPHSGPWPEPPADRSVDALAAGLSSPDPQVRWWCLHDLAGRLTIDEPGFEILCPTLREERPELLARSLAALGSWLEVVWFPADDLLPLLVRFCAHPDPEVRANAFRCLHELAGSEQMAREALEEGLQDPVASVRGNALRTWSGNWTETDPPPAAAVPTLIRMARDPSSGVRWNAAAHLRKLGTGAADAVPLLTEALSADEEILRAAAARALRGIGVKSPEVTGALRRVFDRDPSEEVAEEAWWSLKALTGEDLPWTGRFD